MNSMKAYAVDIHLAQLMAEARQARLVRLAREARKDSRPQSSRRQRVASFFARLAEDVEAATPTLRGYPFTR